MISFDITKANQILTEEEILDFEERVLKAHEMLHQKNGAGNEFTGWLDLPRSYDKDEFGRIKKAAEKIKNKAQVLVVIGIGGSYLGAKAAIDFLNNTFYNNLPDDERRGPQIFFAGHNISAGYINDLIKLIGNKDFCINVISKSGTTTEPAIAFRIFKELAEKKYGKEETKERIFVTTDKSKGALFAMAKTEGYETFVIPDDVGGRYSLLTAVGFLPVAASGADIDKIMQGAGDAMKRYSEKSLKNNDCYLYAAARNVLYSKGKNIEILVNYEPSLHYTCEWWKQLYGESEGKDGKGIFPAAVDFSTDLHSMGQYIQDGERNIFETVINIENPSADLMIQADKENLDGLNFLADKTLNFVNKQAFLGTMLAHADGGAPSLVINISEMNEYCFGEMVYFFEKACGISGYLLGVNPFDQPGVEAYKENMFALLGRPSFEVQREELLKRL